LCASSLVFAEQRLGVLALRESAEDGARSTGLTHANGPRRVRETPAIRVFVAS